MSNKEFQEPEEKEMNSNKSDELFDDFHPLDEPVNEKAYTRPNVSYSTKDITGDIPEPSFMPPPLTEPMKEEQKAKKPTEPINPHVNELSNKDKNDAAEKMADLFITGYKLLWNFVDNRMLFDERKIMKMAQDGEIDLSIPIPVSPTVTLTAGEFVEEYNSQSKGTLTVTPEFEEEVKPPLIKVLKKHGLLMTDEQQLMFVVGKHAVSNIFLGYQNYQVKKDILEQMKEMTALSRSQIVTPPPPPPITPNYSEPQYTTPPPTSMPQPEPEPQEEVEVEEYYEEPVYEPQPTQAPDVNEIVNKMTGSYVEPQVIDETTTYQEPNNKKSEGKRGRPKKKK